MSFVASAIGGGASILGGLINSHSQNDAQQAQADAQNKYLANYGQGQQNFLKYLNSIGPQTTYQNSTSNERGTSVVDPHITAQFQPLVNQLTSMLSSRLSGPNSLPPGYLENQIRDINSTYAGAQQANANTAAQFGVSGPQAAAGQIPMQQARAGQIATARGNAPLVAREMQNQDLQMAQGLASAFGRGQTTNSNMTSTTAGSMTAPRPIAPYQAFLPPGPQQPGPVDPTANMVAGGLGASGNLFGTIASWLGSNARQKATAGSQYGANNGYGFGNIGTESQYGSGAPSWSSDGSQQ